MKNLFNKLNPLTWNEAAQRIFAWSMLASAFAFLGLLLLLGDKWAIEHKVWTVVLIVVMASVLFSILWLAAAKRYGARRGLLLALVYFIVWFLGIPVILRLWR